MPVLVFQWEISVVDMTSNRCHFEIGCVTFEMSFKCVNWDSFSRTRSLRVILSTKSLRDRKRNRRFFSNHHDCALTLNCFSQGPSCVVLPRDLIFSWTLAPSRVSFLRFILWLIFLIFIKVILLKLVIPVEFI